MRIRDIMSKPVVVCGRNDTLNDAARLMRERDCGILPVVQDDGRIAGILTDRDICMAAYTQGKSLGAIPVAQAMSRKVVSCRGDDFLESTVRLMADNQVRRVPVLDAEDRPVGMVSFSDLVRHAAAVIRGDGIDYDVIKGYASISRPRQPFAGPAENPVLVTPARSPGIPATPRPPRATA